MPQVHPSLTAAGDQREQVLGQAHRIGMDGGQPTGARHGAHRTAHRLDDRRVTVPEPAGRPGRRQVQQIATVGRHQRRAVARDHLQREEPQLLDPRDDRLVALVERRLTSPVLGCTGGVRSSSRSATHRPAWRYPRQRWRSPIRLRTSTVRAVERPTRSAAPLTLNHSTTTITTAPRPAAPARAPCPCLRARRRTWVRPRTTPRQPRRAGSRPSGTPNRRRRTGSRC